MTVDVLTVTCGDAVMTADRRPDPSRPAYNVWTSSSGLDGGLGVESTKTDRLSDGAVLSGARRPGREITVAGTWFGPGESAARAFIDGLTAVGAGGAPVRLHRTTGAGERRCTAALDGAPKITAVVEDAWARVEWELPLYAADPRLYGREWRCQCRTADPGSGLRWPLFDPDGALDWGTLSGLRDGLLANAGTVDAHPTVILTGNALSGCVLSDGAGHDVVYRGPVTTRSPVTVDFAAGRAEVAGGDTSALITGRAWWTVPPGGSVAPAVRSLQDGATLIADFTCYDTYI